MTCNGALLLLQGRSLGSLSSKGRAIWRRFILRQVWEGNVPTLGLLKARKTMLKGRLEPDLCSESIERAPSSVATSPTSTKDGTSSSAGWVGLHSIAWLVGRN